jgi:hypothetical protein
MEIPTGATPTPIEMHKSNSKIPTEELPIFPEDEFIIP